MKKNIIIILTISFIIALLGIIFIIVGLKINNRFTGNLVYKNNSNNTVEKTFIVDDVIEDIYIDSSGVLLNIVYDNSIKQIEVQIIDFYSENDIELSYENKKLIIDTLIEADVFLKRRNIHKYPKVVISIPEGSVFNIVNIENKASDMNIDYIDAKKLNIENNAANIDIKKIKAEYINFENKSGNISIKSLSEAIDIKIENKVGNVEITMEGDGLYSEQVDNNVGEVSIFGKAYQGIKVKSSNGSRLDKNINIENNVGRVIIK